MSDTQVQAFEARDACAARPHSSKPPTVNEEAPVVRVVQMVITQALRDRASDIHIEPHDDRIRVRYRIDGALHEVLTCPARSGPAIVSRIKIMAGHEHRRAAPAAGRSDQRWRSRTVEVDIRVSTTAVVGGEKVVMRLLDKSRPHVELEQLGMPDDIAERYSSLLNSRRTAWSSARDRPAAARPPRSTPRWASSTAPSATS